MSRFSQLLLVVIQPFRRIKHKYFNIIIIHKQTITITLFTWTQRHDVVMITIAVMNLQMVETKLQIKTNIFCSHVDTKPRDELFAAATTLRTRARAPLRNKCDKKPENCTYTVLKRLYSERIRERSKTCSRWN